MTVNRSSASILARLLVLAKRRGDDYSLLLNRFARWSACCTGCRYHLTPTGSC